MSNKKNLKIRIIILMLAVSLLIQACSIINQNEMTKTLEVKDNTVSENLPEKQTADETEGEAHNEMINTDESLIKNNQTETPQSVPDISVEIDSVTDNLTDDEIAGLIFMREEEKLAKDVYLGLYDLWGLNIFQNIASSEQTHTDAVKNLLDMFDIEDPADTSPTGVFANEDLQKLYDDLMVIGAQSLDDALKVGAAIEEIDILDLQEYLETTQDDKIRRVYQNLLRGSENHLRAFTSTLERQTGEIYEPQYMSRVDYDAIVLSGSSQGGRGRGNRP